MIAYLARVGHERLSLGGAYHSFTTRVLSPSPLSCVVKESFNAGNPADVKNFNVGNLATGVGNAPQ